MFINMVSNGIVIYSFDSFKSSIVGLFVNIAICSFNRWFHRPLMKLQPKDFVNEQLFKTRHLELNSSRTIQFK